ncbi:unnamed protein product [Brachionus calyciflorus]|uniref:Uncharacterized protein n=1 Tax=Brachionus calyciflorus TaxID=104777 RepID=A0A813UW65_9BILA|nr:unnamed protein product [Brachionus calyciflorus]
MTGNQAVDFPNLTGYSPLRNCQDPSIEYLQSLLVEHDRKFKKVLNHSNSLFHIHKYYTNLILKLDEKVYESTDNNTFMARIEMDFTKEITLNRIDRFPFKITHNICRSKFHFDAESRKFTKCQNIYELVTVLGRGLCDTRKMEWQWNQHFENRSISCSC